MYVHQENDDFARVQVCFAPKKEMMAAKKEVIKK